MIATENEMQIMASVRDRLLHKAETATYSGLLYPSGLLKMNNSNTSVQDTTNILQQNCRIDWPIWTCIFANVCGLTSTTLWFLVLLPQVWKNFRRKSVMGLSVLWATANFTASLINLFFVFIYVEIPLYGKISSVYCPVLELTLLSQFWLYGHQYGRRSKFVYLFGCLITWTTIILLQLLLRIFDELQWIAIALWCVETFPQVILNMKIQSTSGQSNKSVFIALCGKTTDFLSNYILVLPLQYVVMVYFSSSVAYVNGIQVAWYYHDNNQSERSHSGTCPEADESDDSLLEDHYADDNGRSLLENHYANDNGRIIQTNAKHFKERIKQLFSVRHIVLAIGIFILLILLVVLVVGLVWNTGSYLGLLGPIGIVLVMSISYGYLEIKRHRAANVTNLLSD